MEEKELLDYQLHDIWLHGASWGWNSNNRAGNLTEINVEIPRQLQRSKIRNYIDCSAGRHHTLFVSDQGNVYSFGDGRYGQLGYGNLFTGKPTKGGIVQGVPRGITPTGKLKFGRDIQCVQVSAGGTFSVAREASPIERTASIIEFNQLEHAIIQLFKRYPDSEAIRRVWSIIRHERFIIDRSAEGLVITWGTGKNGELGLGHDIKFSPYPQVNVRLRNTCITHIAAGDRHVLAIDSNGRLYSWGCGKAGRLGHGDFEDRVIPEPVKFFGSMFIVAAAAGTAHSAVLAIARDFQGEQIRKVLCFGRGAHGRLGNGTNRSFTTPVLVKEWPPSIIGSQFHQIACGGAHTVVLASKPIAKGLVFPLGIQTFVLAWGYGANGQLGTAYRFDSFKPVKCRLPKAEIIVEITAGKSWTIARTMEGTLFSWGKGLRDQLGQGSDHKFSFLPRQVDTFGSYLSIEGGYAHNVGIYIKKKKLTLPLIEKHIKENPNFNPFAVSTKYLTLAKKSSLSLTKFICCRRLINNYFLIPLSTAYTSLTTTNYPSNQPTKGRKTNQITNRPSSINTNPQPSPSLPQNPLLNNKLFDLDMTKILKLSQIPLPISSPNTLINSPKVRSPKIVSPKSVSPKVKSPKIKSPKAASPKVKSPKSFVEETLSLVKSKSNEKDTPQYTIYNDQHFRRYACLTCNINNICYLCMSLCHKDHIIENTNKLSIFNQFDDEMEQDSGLEVTFLEKLRLIKNNQIFPRNYKARSNELEFHPTRKHDETDAVFIQKVNLDLKQIKQQKESRNFASIYQKSGTSSQATPIVINNLIVKRRKTQVSYATTSVPIQRKESNSGANSESNSRKGSEFNIYGSNISKDRKFSTNTLAQLERLRNVTKNTRTSKNSLSSSPASSRKPSNSSSRKPSMLQEDQSFNPSYFLNYCNKIAVTQYLDYLFQVFLHQSDHTHTCSCSLYSPLSYDKSVQSKSHYCRLCPNISEAPEEHVEKEKFIYHPKTKQITPIRAHKITADPPSHRNSILQTITNSVKMATPSRKTGILGGLFGKSKDENDEVSKRNSLLLSPSASSTKSMTSPHTKAHKTMQASADEQFDRQLNIQEMGYYHGISPAVVKIQAMARCYIAKKKYFEYKRYHIEVRRHVCIEYVKAKIMKPIWNKLTRAYAEYNEEKERQLMAYEEELIRKFNKFKKIQLFNQGMKATFYGIRHMVGQSSILFPIMETHYQERYMNHEAKDIFVDEFEKEKQRLDEIQQKENPPIKKGSVGSESRPGTSVNKSLFSAANKKAMGLNSSRPPSSAADSRPGSSATNSSTRPNTSNTSNIPGHHHTSAGFPFSIAEDEDLEEKVENRQQNKIAVRPMARDAVIMVPKAWYPSYAFSWASIRDLELRKHPKYRFTPDILARITQYFPRSSDAIYKECHYYDPDINNLTKKFIRSKRNQGLLVKHFSNLEKKYEAMQNAAGLALQKLKKQQSMKLKLRSMSMKNNNNAISAVERRKLMRKEFLNDKQKQKDDEENATRVLPPSVSQLWDKELNLNQKVLPTITTTEKLQESQQFDVFTYNPSDIHNKNPPSTVKSSLNNKLKVALQEKEMKKETMVVSSNASLTSQSSQISQVTPMTQTSKQSNIPNPSIKQTNIPNQSTKSINIPNQSSKSMNVPNQSTKSHNLPNQSTKQGDIKPPSVTKDQSDNNSVQSQPKSITSEGSKQTPPSSNIIINNLSLPMKFQRRHTITDPSHLHRRLKDMTNVKFRFNAFAKRRNSLPTKIQSLYPLTYNFSQDASKKKPKQPGTTSMFALNKITEESSLNENEENTAINSSLSLYTLRLCNQVQSLQTEIQNYLDEYHLRNEPKGIPGKSKREDRMEALKQTKKKDDDSSVLTDDSKNPKSKASVASSNAKQKAEDSRAAKFKQAKDNRWKIIITETRKLFQSSVLTPRLPYEMNEILIDRQRRRSIAAPERMLSQLNSSLDIRDEYMQFIQLVQEKFHIKRRRRSFDYHEEYDEDYFIYEDLDMTFEDRTEVITISKLKNDSVRMTQQMMFAGFIETTPEMFAEIKENIKKLKKQEEDLKKLSKLNQSKVTIDPLAQNQAGGKAHRETITDIINQQKTQQPASKEPEKKVTDPLEAIKNLYGEVSESMVQAAAMTPLVSEETKKGGTLRGRSTRPGRNTPEVQIWQEHYSDEGYTYFFNLASNESVWEMPTGRNIQIETRHNDEYGRSYWFNNTTGESRWDDDQSSVQSLEYS